jgi:hypothetical protein
LSTARADCTRYAARSGKKHEEEGACALSHSRQRHLDWFWRHWFAPLQLRNQPSGTTVLSGSLPDQAALYGVLLKIDRLGLILLSLESNETRHQHGGAPEER